jgi:NAD(P)-dependent dehydrogenase (short-subunit alcohol dehydrogenase family)
MLLENKIAVIYGAGGAIGGAVSRAFTAEGANVFLTGRHLKPVEVVADEVASLGGSAEAAEVDALDGIYPPNLRLTAFAWSVCARRRCQRHARSRTSSRLAPRPRE